MTSWQNFENGEFHKTAINLKGSVSESFQLGHVLFRHPYIIKQAQVNGYLFIDRLFYLF